jgi:hypothetical protein
MASEFNTPSAALVPLIYGDNPETWTTAILCLNKSSARYEVPYQICLMAQMDIIVVLIIVKIILNVWCKLYRKNFNETS